jgi:PAS domain S-box-containing protein
MLDTPQMLNSLGDGAYVTDLSRRIVFWNRAAERITGWAADAVVNRCCRDNILAHRDKDGHPLCGHDHCPLHRAMVTGQPSQESEVLFALKKNGARIPVEVSVAPVRDRQGRIVGGIEVFRDLSAAMKDMLRAKAIQEMAISYELPDDDRIQFQTCYQAHDLVGGDFFRIEQLDQDHYGIVLADAVGHGVAAALNTMQLRSLWDTLRRDLKTPGRFMAAISQRVHPLTQEDGYYGTAFYTLINAASGRLSSVCAGHPPQLLFRTGGSVETVGTPGDPLGMLPDGQYEESPSQLEPGDALLLFTDGATEVFDGQKQQLGSKGLERLVRAQTLPNPPTKFSLVRLEEQLLEFSHVIRLQDDLALIKVTWSGPVTGSRRPASRDS